MPEAPCGNSGKLADPEWRKARARKAGQARTSPEYHLARIREIVERTRAKQGLPPVVADELTLARIAELVRAASLQKEAA